jgi:DNA-binding transcriptional regulator YiaG
MAGMREWTPEEIRQFRESLKLSQKAFGELLGKTRNAIYYLERGEREASRTLKLLMDCIEEKHLRERKEKGE